MLRTRRWLNVLAAAMLVGGPAALAFFSGGFFEQPRLVAAVLSWLLVALAAVVAERPLPQGLPGRLVLGGLVLFAGWSALSLTWAPLGSPAMADVERLALYCGFLIAAAAWLRPQWVRAWVEPGLALGAVVVIGYGMSERFLPGVVKLEHSLLAFGRLEQPLTYWNGMGLLAAIGLVLCARLAGSAGRPVALRAAAAAAAPLLGGAVFLTLSRGAFAAAAVGLLVLLALGGERSQPRAVALVAGAAAAAAALAAELPDLDQVGPAASRSSGAALLAATALLALGAALLQRRFAADKRDGERRAAGSLKRWRAISVIMLGLVVALALVGATSPERGAAELRSRPQRTQRLHSLESDRYRYWGVALDSFAAHPLKGVGTAGFRVEWAREVGGANTVRDAHSLYLETAAELGLVGLALLALLLGGVVVSARRALARDLTAALGPVAVLAVWAFHAGLDWDWELPAVTLPVLACAGVVTALGNGSAQPPRNALKRRRAVLAKRGS